MKTRKRLIIALLMGAAMVSAMLMIGCPTPANPGGGQPPGNGTTPDTEYDIVREALPNDGSIELNPATWKAKSGATVTITLKPDPGYEPNNLAAYQTGYHPLTLQRTSEYTYTFTMPASLVRIRVEFIPVIDALKSAAGRISVSSSWEDIAALNTMIRRAQNLAPTDPDEQDIITNAIAKIAGEKKEDPDEGKDPWEKAGIITLKMRNEDLTKWVPLTYPSYPMDTGADMIVKEDFPYGVDRTHLYYVKESNPNLPAPVLGRGWQGGDMYELKYEDDDSPEYDGILEMPLIFEVGYDEKNSVEYTILLWPVAQYTIQYDIGTDGNVFIEDHEEDDDDDPLVPFGRQTLNKGTSQAIGFVGKRNEDGSREVYVRILTNRQNVLISVNTGSGNLVRNKDGDALLSNIKAGDEPGEYGEFYPESRLYILRMRPSTPPTAAAEIN